VKIDGHVFIVLPLACVTNSRYLTNEMFVTLMTSLGFKLIQHKESNQLVFYHLQLKEKTKPSAPWNRQCVRTGHNRNNFCIILSTQDLGLPTKPKRVREEKKGRKEKTERKDNETEDLVRLTMKYKKRKCPFDGEKLANSPKRLKQ